MSPSRPGIRPRDYRGLPRLIEASLRRPGLRPLPAPVVDGGARLDPVRSDLDRADPVLDQDPDRLRPPRALPRVADHVALEDQPRRLAADADAGGARAPPVVLDDVALQAVAVRRHPLGLVSEEHAVGAVADDPVVAQQVVGVLVADRDPEPAVALQAVALEHAVADPPAEEQAVGAVAPRDVTPQDGPLRAAAGVEPEAGVVLADAVDDRHVFRLLEA